jgi:hypothetical protein
MDDIYGECGKLTCPGMGAILLSGFAKSATEGDVCDKYLW